MEAQEHSHQYQGLCWRKTCRTRQLQLICSRQHQMRQCISTLWQGQLRAAVISSILCVPVFAMPPQPPESYDVVFSNWLLMYLSDEEVQDLAARILSWVSLGHLAACTMCRAE